MCAAKILIVDDEPDFRFSMCLILERRGYAVAEAANGIEALEVLAASQRERRPVDLLITDLNMPSMNGLELLENLTQQGLNPAILAMSAYDYKHSQQLLKARGCRKIMAKPFYAEELLQNVAEALEQRQTRI